LQFKGDVTDQEGEASRVYLSPAAMRAIAEWCMVAFVACEGFPPYADLLIEGCPPTHEIADSPANRAALADRRQL
jgi:hypothetical protein